MSDQQFRNLIVSSARSWVGTPFQHQASVREQGADCLGLVRGVWRECIGAEVDANLTYGASWSVGQKDDVLLNALDQHLHRTESDFDKFGDVLVFNLPSGRMAKHLAISVGANGGVPKMVHSYSSGGVVECFISDAWKRRCIAQFQFPRGT